MSEKKINLLDLDRKSMRALFAEMGEKPFRADQLMKWVYHFGVSDFEQMTNINKALRAKLARKCEIVAPEIASYQKSADGTIKFAINVGNGQEVETVYIPEDDRATLCVSSQVGCALECTFCSTGPQGFNRNLSVSEIVGQIWRVADFIGFVKDTGERPITNVVMMGMGEPLLNLKNVIPAMDIMLDDFGFSLSKRRVTVSTSGVVPALDILGDALLLVIILVSAIILPNLAVGLMVAVFQAATSINEQTLSFLPRLIVTLLALIIGGHWLVQKVMDYTIRLIGNIPSVIV